MSTPLERIEALERRVNLLERLIAAERAPPHRAPIIRPPRPEYPSPFIRSEDLDVARAFEGPLLAK